MRVVSPDIVPWPPQYKPCTNYGDPGTVAGSDCTLYIFEVLKRAHVPGHRSGLSRKRREVSIIHFLHKLRRSRHGGRERLHFLLNSNSKNIPCPRTPFRVSLIIHCINYRDPGTMAGSDCIIIGFEPKKDTMSPDTVPGPP